VKKFFYKIWSKFLTFFGDIKIFKYPFWMVYDPDYFQMSGEKILEAIEILEPGDIILRGYNKYLDGCFINGDYSHGAVYIGNNTIIHAVAPKVEKINAVEFMECDRIAIFRPSKYKASAVKIVRKFLKDNVAYDFNFDSKDDGSLFCFELAAKAYPKFNIPTFVIKKFFGLIKKEVYLAQSFFECHDLELVFEYNPKKNIDFVK
jgi:hypothetical protein